MRKRYQEGSVRPVNGKWIGQWRDEYGVKRKRVLGRVGKVTKSDAKAALAEILAPINSRGAKASEDWNFGDFVRQVYFPFFERKWKRTTIMTNKDRIGHHLLPEFEPRPLRVFDRDSLQAFLDRKADAGLSYSIVAHLRWDLNQIFRMAVAEGALGRNPAAMLFVPRECPRPNTAVMTLEEVRILLANLDAREQLIARLALFAGMRPGEIFGLKWGRLERDYADIRQRVYRADIDTPKSFLSVRWAALPDGLVAAIDAWRAVSIDTRPEAWVFPSERLTTPVSKDNCWRRSFKPKLKAVGLGWVDFQVMRKTHNCLMKEVGADPKVRAEQMGHSVDVNENVYTRTALERRRAAVNAVESLIM